MSADQNTIALFLNAMREKEIDIVDDLIADGKLRRYRVNGDKKGTKNAWAILHLDGAKPAGAFGCNRRWGADAKFTWTGKGSAPLTPQERREFKIRMEEKRAQRAAEDAATRAAAADWANQIWNQATDCVDHGYLARKGVKSYGLRVGPWEKLDKESGEVRLIANGALLVPIRDLKKKIHSLQAVFAEKVLYGDRDKDFLKDGAKEGLFYSFGKPLTVDYLGVERMVIVIGEGYATLASIHEATGHACIVAFDAGNLMPVAKSIAARFPDALIIFAADNDQWTERPVKNPGLTRARQAADAVSGLVVYPRFGSNAEGKPTDFNDLHRISGLAAIAQEFAGALVPGNDDPEPDAEPEPVPLPWEGDAQPVATTQPPAAALPTQPPIDEDPEDDDEGPARNGYFVILGYNRGTYYIFQHGKRQIAPITKGDMSEIGLIEIAPLNWWEQWFPGEKSKIDTKSAAEFIIRTSERRGIYDPSKVRGRGAWIDGPRMVYHHGDYLSVDGQPTDVTKITSRYVYELDRSLMAPADTSMTDEEGGVILDFSTAFRWSKPGSAALMAGWVALAPMCGALKWRPHIWLTGGAGCGKSTVLNDFAHFLLDGIDLMVQGNSSEAGIRQTLGHDARPVVFDESESNEEGDARRIQNILSLIRQASTESDAQTLKGTSGGSSMSYHVRSMFCLASIQTALKQQADIERLSVLELRPKREDPDPAATWAMIQERRHAVKRDPTLPSRLFRRSLDLLPITIQNIDVFSTAAAKHFNSQRDGDQYGTLLAGAWSLISRDLATSEQAMHMIQSFDWSEHRDRHDTDEAQRALSALMEGHIRIKGGIEVTVFELVKSAYGDATDIVDLNADTANSLLQRHGMKVRGDRMLISNSSDEFRRLMSGTTFSADSRSVLLRVQGADRNNNVPVKFNGVQSKCISLPLGPLVTDDSAPAF